MQYDQEDYTKFYIVQALFKLMKEYNYDKISVTDIVKKAGVGRLFNVSMKWLDDGCKRPIGELADMIVDAVYFEK